MTGPHPIPVEIVPWIAWSAERVLLPVIVGAVGGMISAWFVGKRTSRFIEQTAAFARDQLIENIQPNLRISLTTSGLVQDFYRCVFQVTAHDDSKPAKLLGTELEASCTIHGATYFVKGADISSMPLLTASSSRGVVLMAAARCASEECNWKWRIIVRYEDYRGLRVYEQDSNGKIVIVQTRKTHS